LFSRIRCNKSINNYLINTLNSFRFVGDVVLTNLKIRENALDDLDLPVQLIYGYLGKLNKLKIAARFQLIPIVYLL